MIDVTLEKPGEYHFVRSVDTAGICIGPAVYTSSIILTPEQIMENWAPAEMESIKLVHLESLFALEPEVALLGTGSVQQFLPRELMIEVIRRGIGLEVMTTDAACRTFNILASDGRRVAAGLLPMRMNPA